MRKRVEAFNRVADALQGPQSRLDAFNAALGSKLTQAGQVASRAENIAESAMEMAAFDSFQAFAAIVRRCQSAGRLRPIETVTLTGLIHATLHGAIDLELGGRAKEAKGQGSIKATVDPLLDLLAEPGQLATV